MEEEKGIMKPADARVVRAVRKLKSSVNKIDKKIDSSKNLNNIYDESRLVSRDSTRTNTKLGLRPVTMLQMKEEKKHSPSQINPLKKIGGGPPLPMRREGSRISVNKMTVDGSIKKNNMNILGSLPKSNKIVNRVFDYETLKRYKKRQNIEFQKNLLSGENINKIKEECALFIKKDKEINSMLKRLNLIKDNNYKEYVEQNFFNKPYLFVALEMLIFEAIEQANTLKVFRTRDVLPLKKVKENFFKDEIMKDLSKQIYQIEYENKSKMLVNSLNNFVQEIKDENFSL